MISSHQLSTYLENLLKAESFEDYCPNGLQIEGKSELKTLAFAVSATQESVTRAVKAKADALIVHHGLFWKFHGAKAIVGPHYKRISTLIKNDINLFAYHLPLDAHQELGNAASLAYLLGLENLRPFGDYRRSPLGVWGNLKTAEDSESFKNRLEKILAHPVLWAKGEKAQIKTFGIITGGANNEWKFAYENNLDAYITGEMSEHNYHDASEHGVHMFAGGHHATEKFGIQNLQKHLEQTFKIKTVFLDSENPA